MFEILVVIAFIWLLCKVLKFAFRLTWGMAKVVASILMVIAAPMLILCLIFASGVLLLIPLALLAIAFCNLKGLYLRSYLL